MGKLETHAGPGTNAEPAIVTETTSFGACQYCEGINKHAADCPVAVASTTSQARPRQAHIQEKESVKIICTACDVVCINCPHCGHPVCPECEEEPNA